VCPPVLYEPYTQREDYLPKRKTIKRNSKLLQCLSLPIISVLRSLLPKINNFKTDILEREIGLSLLLEICEVKGKKKHLCEITKMLEVEGLKYISTLQILGKFSFISESTFMNLALHCSSLFSDCMAISWYSMVQYKEYEKAPAEMKVSREALSFIIFWQINQNVKFENFK
jgi:hypothetical protein